MHKITCKPIALALVIASLLVNAPRSQTAPTAASVTTTNEDRIALYQALLDLQNPWTVMCIAAHPDDEDGTSLTVLRHKYGAHTVSVFSTFGEGGQNAIGPELYEELGAIRVRETMAAAEIQGSEPYFLGLKDFGYSKSADEAFKVWGHDEPLRRMVLQIRKLRPDVIITNHDTTSGHGHHQATGRLELEAFDAAADPKRFPEQLKDGLTTWQVQRLFVLAGFGGGPANAAPKPDQEPRLVTIDPNEQDPIRGTTYAQQALAALQKHATQGPWPKTVADMARFRNSADGRLPSIRYRLTREAKGAAALATDAHNFLDGLRLPDGIAKQLEPPTINGQPLTASIDNRTLVLEQLKAYRRKHATIPLDRSVDVDRLLAMAQVMEEKVQKALALAAGVTLKVEPSIIVTPNSTVDLPLKISNSGIQTVGVLGCSSCAANSACLDADPELVRPDNLMPGSALSRSNKLQFPDKMPINTPLSSHLYEPNALGLQVNTSCSIQLENFRVHVIKSTRVNVASAVEIAKITPSPYVFTPANLNAPLAFKVQLVNHLDKPFKGEFGIDSPTEHIHEIGADIALGPRETCDFPLLTNVIPVDTPDEKRTPRADFGSIVFSVHPPESVTVITEAETHVVYADARVAPKLRVGYLRGFDYSLPNALATLGVESKELTLDDVRTADLQKYSTIIIDNRVYESQPELIAANGRLLDYAKDGGTLVVFYHKSNEWNFDPGRNRPQLSPYPLSLGEQRVTDENAPVTFTEPEHPLLNFPNKIGQEDFVGWIQERGLYYPRLWEDHYHALLSMGDPGEKPLAGGLLVAEYGRGHYIYTSMVWYRQLRAGVPGGYRMFANIISYGHQ